MRKSKILIMLVVIIIIIISIFLGMKFYKINKILKYQENNYNIANYYAKIKQYIDYEENYNIIEIYSDKNIKYIVTENIKYFIDDNKKETYIINEVDKSFQIIKNEKDSTTGASDGIYNLLYNYKDSDFLEKLQYVFKWKIENSNINNTECYHIILENNNEIWIDKEKMLEKKNVIRENNYESITIIEELKLNDIKTEIKLPNLDEYKMIEK